MASWFRISFWTRGVAVAVSAMIETLGNFLRSSCIRL